MSMNAMSIVLKKAQLIQHVHVLINQIFLILTVDGLNIKDFQRSEARLQGLFWDVPFRLYLLLFYYFV